ncbi:protein of unknown function DUF323 [Chitinispirillum alkaliphilum]|nr:protein of unknown function DUF323 [Chitinispirillum alkaliphilum]
MYKFLGAVINVVIFCSVGLFADDHVVPLRFSAASSSGEVRVWSISERREYRLEELERLEAGHTLTTRENSSVELVFEPAAVLSVSENSVVSLQNLLRDNNSNIIRMHLLVQRGSVSVNTGVTGQNTFLITVKTPCANIDLQNGEIEVNILADHSQINVRRGDIKVRNIASQAKTTVYSGSSVKVYQNRRELSITDIDIERSIPKRTTRPSIAILSIQSNAAEQQDLIRISDLVAQQYESSSNTKVLYLDDIRNLLRAENLTGLLECFTDSCISKIGSSIGADYAIVGDLGQLGSSYIFGLRLIDVLKYQVVSRASVSVRDDVGKIVEEIPQLVSVLAQRTEEQLVARDQNVSYGNEGFGGAHYRQRLVWIEPGQFVMGSSYSNGNIDELPRHNVTLNGFYMHAYEVTRDEFEEVMGFNPSAFKGCGSCPVDNVTWFEADEYCRKINMRLPTEAEWEYAARAGTTTIFHYGNTLSSTQANFNGREPFGGVPVNVFRERPVPVGSYEPNNWKLYDMHGNVAEWVSDWYDVAWYGNSPGVNPRGPADGRLRAARGGSWRDPASSLRSARRVGYNPSIRLNTLGFRCAMDYE